MIRNCQTCGFPFVVRYPNENCGSELCKKINKIREHRTNSTSIVRRINLRRLCKKYYQEHKEKHYQKTREYIKKNPITKKLAYINYINKHRDKELKRLREWKRKNKDKYSETNRKWKQKNNFRLRLYKIKRKSKEGNIELTEQEWQYILKKYNYKCYWCGCKLYKYRDTDFIKKQERTIEHLISINKNGKTTKENIVPACLSHNSSKRNLSEQEFIEYIRKDTNNPNWKPFGVVTKIKD